MKTLYNKYFKEEKYKQINFIQPILQNKIKFLIDMKQKQKI